VKLNKKLYTAVLTLSIIGIYCSVVDENPVNTGVVPAITDIKISDKWNTRSAKFYQIEATVSDPQGLSNIAATYLIVSLAETGETIFSDSLYDEGSYFHPEAGDVFAGDGVFTNRYQTEEISNIIDQKEYIFRISAIDREEHESLLHERSVIFGPNSPPEILNISAPDTLPFEVENVIFSITVSDSDGIDDISRAYFESENIKKGFTIFESDLHNDGDIDNHGDQIAGDSVFSVKVSSAFVSGKIGQYNLIFYLEDSYRELNQNAAVKPIVIGNLPGQIHAISAPDTMQIPSSSGTYNRALLTAEVSDPEGLADIDSVYFYSRKPDSSLANNGSPIVMVDNGLPFNPQNLAVETGDQVAGDGIYSFSLLVISEDNPGRYTFSFYMRDEAGNLTGPIEKKLLLVGN
jgi:hypothetical protein